MFSLELGLMRCELSSYIGRAVIYISDGQLASVACKHMESVIASL